MTEDEWLFGTDSLAMLEFLSDKASERKLLLFSCAAALRMPDLHGTFLFKSIELVVRKADGSVGENELSVAWKNGPHDTTAGVVQAWLFGDQMHDLTMFLADWVSTSSKETWPDLLRDIFDNPLRPTPIHSKWLSPTVTNLATVAYEERVLPFGELVTARLAILADALEDAGCDNQEILGHLRSPRLHVRGCFALDLLLGRE